MGKRNDHLIDLIENIWAWGFGLVGTIASPSREHWSSPGGKKILVLAPHPDDEALGCAGTILLHKQSGDTVWSITISDGSASRAFGLSQKEIRHLRREESQTCAQILEIDHPIWLNLRESGWQVDKLIGYLDPLFDDIQPDILYAPSYIDFHPEHKKVALALGTLFRSKNWQSQGFVIRAYQIHVPLTPLLTNLISPVDTVMDRVRSALKSYTTQSGSMAQTYRLRRYAGNLYGISQHVEEFWSMSPAAYARFNTLRRPIDSDYDFKGLLPNPLLDPYIYVNGALRRRQIANLSKSSRD